MLRNAMAVLELYSTARPQLGVVETAELLGRPKNTVSRWLSQMRRAGFLDRDPDTGRYTLSLRLMIVGEIARQVGQLEHSAAATLQRIAQVTGETSNLVVLVGNEGVNVDAALSPHRIMHMGAIGKRFPLHGSAAGKALIAWRTEEEIREMLPAPLARYTAGKITDYGELLEDLAEVRRLGYATNFEEYEEDLVGVGAPVRDGSGRVVAALAISAPAYRMTRELAARMGREIAREACIYSAKLGYRAPEELMVEPRGS